MKYRPKHTPDRKDNSVNTEQYNNTLNSTIHGIKVLYSQLLAMGSSQKTLPSSFKTMEVSHSLKTMEVSLTKH